MAYGKRSSFRNRCFGVGEKIGDADKKIHGQGNKIWNLGSEAIE
jgi:hypothetical protein